MKCICTQGNLSPCTTCLNADDPETMRSGGSVAFHTCPCVPMVKEAEKGRYPMWSLSSLCRQIKELLETPCLWVTILVLLAHWSVAQNAESPLVVKAAVLSDFPPQYSLKDDGTPSGFAVEVMDELARIAGIQVEYVVRDDWTEMFDALQTAEVDLIPNQGITEKRREMFVYSLPVETFPVSIFTRKYNREITDLASLAGKTVAIVKLNIGETLIKACPSAEVKLFTHAEDALFSLLSGNVEALIFPEPVIWELTRTAGIEDRVQTVGNPLIEVKRAIAVRKEDKNLLGRFNQAIATFIGTPQYREIYAHWHSAPPPYWMPRRMAFFMSMGIILAIVGMGFWRYQTLHEANRKLEQRVEERTRDLRDVHSHG